MDGKTIMLAVGFSILLFTGIWSVSLVSASVPLQTYTGQASMVFATNNTAVSIPNPAITITGLYNTSAAPRCAWEAYASPGPGDANGGYVVSAGLKAVTIYTNNTDGPPAGTSKTCANMTTGTYTLDYKYQNALANSTFSSVESSVWNSFTLIAVVLIVLAAAAILGYFGFATRAD